jgi:hypothetical protein
LQALEFASFLRGVAQTRWASRDPSADGAPSSAIRRLLPAIRSPLRPTPAAGLAADECWGVAPGGRRLDTTVALARDVTLVGTSGISLRSTLGAAALEVASGRHIVLRGLAVTATVVLLALTWR